MQCIESIFTCDDRKLWLVDKGLALKFVNLSELEKMSDTDTTYLGYMQRISECTATMVVEGEYLKFDLEDGVPNGVMQHISRNMYSMIALNPETEILPSDKVGTVRLKYPKYLSDEVTHRIESYKNNQMSEMSDEEFSQYMNKPEC